MFHSENLNQGMKTEKEFNDNILLSSQSLITCKKSIFHITQIFWQITGLRKLMGYSHTKCDDLKQL